MEHNMHTLPSEIGEIGSEGIHDLLKRATAYAPIGTYAENEAPPLSWEELLSAGWDQFGLLDEDGGASCLDLAKLSKAWGYGCISLPLLTTVVAKRHSEALEDSEAAITFALPYGEQQVLVPFADAGNIQFVTQLGQDTQSVGEVPEGTPDTLDLVNRSRIVAGHADMSPDAARDIAVLLAAEAVGAAERLLTDTIEYVKQREQFGRPVGSFQAVKHQLANAAVAVESADTAVIWAAQRPDETYRGALYAVDRCIDVAETAIQAHGGIGFTWEGGLQFPQRKMLSSRRIVQQLEMHYG